MDKINFVIRYIKFWFKAKTKYSIHSPFVFKLLTEVIDVDKEYYAFNKIESIRSVLLKNHHKINTIDFGAGSHIDKSSEIKISTIAKTKANTPKLGKILFRLVDYFQPKTIVELGTSLGISSLYQFSAAPKDCNYYTLEGCKETAKVAQKVFNSFEAKNIQLIQGEFDQQLPHVLDKCQSIDYVFFDGNHQKEPTLKYFKQALNKINENSVLVFDDIHWSTEMESAWEEIKNDERVTVTIDLFWIGLVFFRKGQEKEHFTIKF